MTKALFLAPKDALFLKDLLSGCDLRDTRNFICLAMQAETHFQDARPQFESVLGPQWSSSLLETAGLCALHLHSPVPPLYCREFCQPPVPVERFSIDDLFITHPGLTGALDDDTTSMAVVYSAMRYCLYWAQHTDAAPPAALYETSTADGLIQKLLPLASVGVLTAIRATVSLAAEDVTIGDVLTSPPLVYESIVQLMMSSPDTMIDSLDDFLWVVGLGLVISRVLDSLRGRGTSFTTQCLQRNLAGTRTLSASTHRVLAQLVQQRSVIGQSVSYRNAKRVLPQAHTHTLLSDSRVPHGAYPHNVSRRIYQRLHPVPLLDFVAERSRIHFVFRTIADVINNNHNNTPLADWQRFFKGPTPLVRMINAGGPTERVRRIMGRRPLEDDTITLDALVDEIIIAMRPAAHVLTYESSVGQPCPPSTPDPLASKRHATRTRGGSPGSEQKARPSPSSMPSTDRTPTDSNPDAEPIAILAAWPEWCRNMHDRGAFAELHPVVRHQRQFSKFSHSRLLVGVFCTILLSRKAGMKRKACA